MSELDVRWQQQFAQFEKAFVLLEEAVGYGLEDRDIAYILEAAQAFPEISS